MIVKLAAQIANLLLQKCGMYIKTLNTKCRTATNSVKNNFIKEMVKSLCPPAFFCNHSLPPAFVFMKEIKTLHKLAFPH